MKWVVWWAVECGVGGLFLWLATVFDCWKCLFHGVRSLFQARPGFHVSIDGCFDLVLFHQPCDLLRVSLSRIHITSLYWMLYFSSTLKAGAGSDGSQICRTRLRSTRRLLPTEQSFPPPSYEVYLLPGKRWIMRRMPRMAQLEGAHLRKACNSGLFF